MKRPRRSGRPPRERDQHPTAFTAILEQFLELEPAALGAVLVDGEGEAVDYAGALTPFDIKVTGAHLRIVLDQVGAFAHPVDAKSRSRGQGGSMGRPTQIIVRGVRRSFLARPLSEGYALVIVLKRHGFVISARAIAVSERRLASEAGWPMSAEAGPRWHPVHVETTFGNRRRPLRMLAGSTWQSVEVLGSLVGLGRERGYRCRLRSGAELTLVREPAGTWYADELVDDTTRDERAS
jgi:hypothetical protein